MKTTTTLLIAIFLISAIASIAIPLASAQPQEITILVTQQQTRYYPDGNVMHTLKPHLTSKELRLTGNVLHGEWSYSPPVTNLEGEKYILVYNKESEKWILHEGTVEYTSPNIPNYHVVEYWEGSLTLNEDLQLVEGAFIQYGYSGDQAAKDRYPWAEWDEGKGMWLLAYSIYTYTPPA